nr:hypothetical protein [Tanacetum cinerariifolium]
MDMTIDQQVALDEALVPHASRLRIRRSNFRLQSDISSKESTLQLVYDVLRLTPFFKAFLEFWATAMVYHHSIRFKMDNKKHIVNLEYFREMLHICPRLPGQTFDEPPFEEEILAFLRYLGHNGEIRRLTDVNINKLHQPWRSFTAIINKCLSGKSSGYDSLWLSQAQILWGFYHKRNVDFAYLLWEDFVYQTKASVRKTKSSFDTTVTPPPTAAADDDDDQEEWDDDDDQEEGNDDDQDSGEKGKEFIHPRLSIYDEEETRDEESFDHIPKTPKNTDDEGNGKENLGLNVGREEGQDEEDDEDELYRDVNINLEGRGAPTSVAPLPLSAPTLTPLTIATTTIVQQAPTPLTTAPSTLLQNLPNFGSLFGFDHRIKTLEDNFFDQGSHSNQPDRLRDEAQVDNEVFLKNLDENIQKIIKEQVKEQVKVQVFKILSRIEQTVNEQLKAEVLTRSSNSSKTSYSVAADLSEMKLKKILIEKMEGNKSIHRSNEQRNLIKALVEAYESDKIILDTYGDTVTLKRRRDDDADKDEEPPAGSDRGSKRRREGNEPESASTPKEKATRSAGKSTQGSKSQQTSASESATTEEPMQTTHEMEEPSHLEFETGADDQPIAEHSQHPEWFSQQKKPLTSDRDWNKTLPATHGSSQPWISKLAKQTDSRSSFNELMDTPVHFSSFLMNRLKVDTLTPELLAGPTYKLMKGSCKSLVELEFFLEEFYKATIDQLDWINPEGQQYPHNLLKPLPLIPNSRGRRVIPFDHFINNDLEYLHGGA